MVIILETVKDTVDEFLYFTTREVEEENDNERKEERKYGGLRKLELAHEKGRHEYGQSINDCDPNRDKDVSKGASNGPINIE
jgi:hypothetical protein